MSPMRSNPPNFTLVRRAMTIRMMMMVNPSIAIRFNLSFKELG